MNLEKYLNTTYYSFYMVERGGNLLDYLVIGFMIISLVSFMLKFNVYTGYQVASCTDSDASNFFNIGNVQTATQTLTDSCLSVGNTFDFVQENICVGDVAQTITNQCEYGCAFDASGAALGRCNGDGTLLTCSDNDNGLNLYTKGNISVSSFSRLDVCSGNNVFEWRCDGNRFNYTIYPCYNGCNGNGACENGNINFSVGWNLVGGFAYPGQLLTTSVVKSANIKAIFGLLSTQQYVRLYPTPEQSVLNTLNLTELKNNGFWVYSNLSLTGKALYNFSENLVPFTQRRLFTGYNFYTITPDMLDVSGSTVSSLAGDCNINRAFFFNSTIQLFVNIPLGTLYSDLFKGNITSLAVEVANNCNFNLPPPVPTEFVVQSPTGLSVARFSNSGGIILKGVCTSAAACTPPADSFMIKNAQDQPVAHIDPNGNLCIESGDCSGGSAACTPSVDAFKVQNEASTTVSSIDSNGDLCLIGSLIQNGNP